MFRFYIYLLLAKIFFSDIYDDSQNQHENIIISYSEFDIWNYIFLWLYICWLVSFYAISQTCMQDATILNTDKMFVHKKTSYLLDKGQSYPT